MKTKRIKIERPEDLKEGMRVEVFMWSTKGEDYSFKGQVYKPTLIPSDKSLYVDVDGEYEVVRCDEGLLNGRIKSIHRLIDGIEDVVVGDPVLSSQNHEVLCLFVHQDFIVITGINGQVIWYTVDEMRAHGFRIKAGESQKTELTLQEAKEIIAKAKGCEVDNVIIKDE